jgi:hypothetical protein
MPNKASIAFDRNWKLCKTSTCIPVDTTCGYYLWILPVDTLLLLHTCGDFFIVSYCVLPKSSNDHFMSGIDTATIQQPYILSHLSILRILSTLLLFYSFTLLLFYFFTSLFHTGTGVKSRLDESCTRNAWNWKETFECSADHGRCCLWMAPTPNPTKSW